MPRTPSSRRTSRSSTWGATATRPCASRATPSSASSSASRDPSNEANAPTAASAPLPRRPPRASLGAGRAAEARAARARGGRGALVSVRLRPEGRTIGRSRCSTRPTATELDCSAWKKKQARRLKEQPATTRKEGEEESEALARRPPRRTLRRGDRESRRTRESPAHLLEGFDLSDFGAAFMAPLAASALPCGSFMRPSCMAISMPLP